MLAILISNYIFTSKLLYYTCDFAMDPIWTTVVLFYYLECCNDIFVMTATRDNVPGFLNERVGKIKNIIICLLHGR